MRLQTNKCHRLNRFDEIFSYNSIENPTASGVYVIFIDDKCTYIGCSKNVFSRLKTHIKNAHIFIPRASKMEIAVKLTGKLDYRYCRDLERKLINKIKPQGNFNNNPSQRAVW